MTASVKIDVKKFFKVYLIDTTLLSTKGLFKKIVWSGIQVTIRCRFLL
jgi:hypothetical protein